MGIGYVSFGENTTRRVSLLLYYIYGISDLYILYVVFHYCISLSEYLRCYGVKKLRVIFSKGSFVLHNKSS